MSEKTSEHDEVLALETAYWQAIKDKDADAAMALCDESCMLAGASGTMQLEREQLGEMMNSEQNYELLDFRIEEPDVKVMGDVAVITYKVHEEMIVDGFEVAVEAAEASTWVRRGTDWLCVLHTESILGDPFGRDRILPAPPA